MFALLAEPRERLSCRPNSVLRRKMPTSYRTFKVQVDCLRLNGAPGLKRRSNR
jgi:hypothetical protein